MVTFNTNAVHSQVPSFFGDMTLQGSLTVMGTLTTAKQYTADNRVFTSSGYGDNDPVTLPPNVERGINFYVGTGEVLPGLRHEHGDYTFTNTSDRSMVLAVSAYWKAAVPDNDPFTLVVVDGTVKTNERHLCGYVYRGPDEVDVFLLSANSATFAQEMGAYCVQGSGVVALEPGDLISFSAYQHNEVDNVSLDIVDAKVTLALV